MAVLLHVTAAIMWSATGVGSLWFSIPQSGIKCVSEEIHPNVVVLADYSVFYVDHSGDLPTVSSKVKAELIQTNYTYLFDNDFFLHSIHHCIEYIFSCFYSVLSEF